MFSTSLIPLAVNRRLFSAVVLTGLIWTAHTTTFAANIIHEFYVPMPEAQARTALVGIEPAAGIVGTTMESVVSIVVTGTGTVVHYDEWEDGYEVDINNPTQSTTKIWGDGNNANGIPPGYANDPASLPSGAVINLRNQITLPRNPATILYDGRDRFGGTKALVVTRTGWAVAPGTVLAGSVEVTATMDYGTQYISPVGQDVSANSMFEYVGLMVLARENGTSVTIDLNGPVAGGATTITLNQGESYLANGGVLKGATVTSTKPVQVQLITGDIGARYETDWFTLYPVDQWTGTYYSPVGTASDGDATFGFFYNPTASSITIDVVTCLGTSSFSIPANGVYQYQMPQNCGARFTSVGEVPYFGLVMVGANPSANNVHDWGFTLVPSNSLTTEAVVGWGPGSSDITQNGSPVWVTPTAATRVYVDYNGDRLGSLTDPKGNKYDVHYDMTALETRRLFDPDKDQSAMRVYTLDGIQIAAAWGQDPATAGPGNPFLDVGTTVLPFPVPTLIKSYSVANDIAPLGVLNIGDTIEYRIDVDNKGLLPLGNLLVLDPLNPSLTYVAGTTARDGNAIPDDGVGSTIFPLDESGYVIPIIMRGGNTTFTYRCTINAAGNIANTASNSNYNLVSTEQVVVTPPAGSTPCGAQFTNAAGVLQTIYSAGTLVYGTLTDPDANNDVGTIETIMVAITNTSNGDSEFVTLVETGVNTGVFRNTTGLPTSTTTGTNQMDGTLLVSPGNNLSFTYIDPEFNETCTGNASISVPTQSKYLYLSDPLQALDRVDPVAANDLTTASTSALSYTPPGVIIGTTTSPAPVVNGSSMTFSHTNGSGANRLLIVNVSIGSATNPALAGTVSGVTYNGTAMTQVGTAVSPGAQGGARIYIYRLINPVAGPANVVISASAGSTIQAGATTFENVDQTTPLGAFAPATGASGTATVNVVSATNETVISVGSIDEAGTNQGITTSGGQSQLWNNSGTNYVSGAASTKPGAASVTVSYTATDTSQEWAIGGVSVKPAAGGGATTTSFTQAPAFASAFTMPAGSAPTVTAHYTVSSGSMPGSPTITATLKRGVTTLATSVGTTASAATGSGLFTFTFASLGGAVNFASTEALTLQIDDTQSGVTFAIDFDSTTKPSKITLPTTTVIAVDSLGVYDAPYPGGSLITGPASGTTVYVRSTASDPFGAYDITSMGLNIDGPGAPGDITTTLNAGNVVNTTAGTKTYEYAWTVGSTTGTYNIAVTANEGTEGINATRATSVNVTFLDLGTPSVTEFTTGSNGPDTTTYAGNEQVCVRITDLDQNLDALVAETITATITSLAGDSELVTLTETGVDTGIFVFCIPASTSAPNTFNDGTLHAVLGDVLTVNYVDPTDSTDTGSDTATIPNIAPAVSVNKTLVTPADGQAVVGEALQYTVQVTNTGNTTLNTISLVDTFPTADLTFVNASVAPSSTLPAGTLTWNNVGPLAPGQSVARTLNFTALSTAAPAVNSATADAGGGVNSTDTANVTITNPEITITKTLLSPNPGPANIGDNVVFRIAVQNTGDTAIATLPVEDTYSGAEFDFVSATAAPDATGSGSLLWLDVTGAGNLAVGNTITIDVTLQAKGAAAPATNLARADYTVDVNGDPAPPVGSSATITLIAAMISGHVYDDANTNGAYDPPGDAPLENITVSLYTDPNGDGNPADGVLIDVTTTDVNGAYEFLNLPTGNYVVVESQPPGYSSHSDTAGANDNRIPLVISTLTAFANNDFFDFLTPPVSYASIAGNVWNDADASATVNGGEVGIANVSVDLVEDTNNNGVADPGEPVVASTLTAADGTYSFGGLSAGNYVVVEHDLFGWYSTADSAAPNNNKVPVTLSAGQNATSKDFLDVLTGTTGGKVFRDVNGNGSFDGGDVALADIDVTITDSQGVAQTVVTDASGNWTATVPPGTTTIDVQQSDPQFTAVFVTGYSQTAGADPNNITAVSGVNTPAGDDGFRQVGTVTGHLYVDTNGDGDQDVGEPDLAGVDVVITNVDLVTQTVVTNASGDWTATVPPGNTSANISEADPQFTALVLAGYTQTQGTDPNSFTAVANTSTDGGTDGYFNHGTISGTVLSDLNDDDIGDDPISGVTLTLVDGAGAIIDGDPLTGGVQPITAITDGSGTYTFTDVPPGTYGVKETQPITHLSVTDSDGGDPDEVRPITVSAGGTSTADFVEESPATISGSVLADTDNNDTGDTGIIGVVLTLLDLNGDIIDGDSLTGGIQPITATTDLNGDYSFTNLRPGSYQVSEAQPLTYASLSDLDGGDLDIIGDVALITLDAGETAGGNDFLEEQYGSISGTVWKDTDNNDSGDTAFAGVTLKLLDFTGAPYDGDLNTPGVQEITATTNGSGVFTFLNVPPGDYRVGETQPSGYLSVSDSDGGNLDQIAGITVFAGTLSDGYEFVEEQLGEIRGTVMAGSALENVVLTLFTDPNGDGNPADGSQVGSTVLTDAGGLYVFTNVEPGNYVVLQTQPSGYVSVSDGDTTTPGDDAVNASGTDNSIPVGIAAGEVDDGNDFTEGCPTITVNQATLPDGVVGTAYNQTLSASGGTAPYAFAVTSGALPAGLTLSGGVIAGTPTSSATANFTITATDNLGCTGTRSYTVTPVCPTITVNPSSLPDATVGSSYNQTLSATGGTAPYTFAVTVGTLPAGLTLTSDTIGGTATSAGPSTFTITATDDNGCTGTRSLTISAVCPTITVSPASLPNGVVGTAYNQTLSASGGTAPYAFAVTTGVLPTGLTLLGDTISGTPTSNASQTFTITATDDNGCEGTRSFAVAPVCPTISLASVPAVLPSGTVGVAYNGTITANGGTPAYTFAVKVGSSLPPGLSISGAGSITGTPTTNGTTNTIIVATDANGCSGETTFVFNIGCNTLGVAPGSVANGVVGTPYTPVVFSSTGGTGVITWSQTGVLPAGMTFNTGTATLGGTPTEAGTFSITIIATDANTCSGSVNLTFSTSCPTVTVNPTTLPNGIVGTAYSEQLSAADGTAPYTFAVTTGVLPAGLTLVGDTISGTPTATTSQTFTITATDDNGCEGTRSFTVAPVCPTITVNPATLPDGVVGTAYNQTLSAIDGTAPYAFAVTSGALPAGLNLSGGVISGTPTSTASATFVITATDNHGCTGTRSFTLAPTCPTITVNPASLPDPALRTTYTQTLTVLGGTAPYTFAVTTGALPAGLTLVGNTITGTPTAAGPASFTITVTDDLGCEGARNFDITVLAGTISGHLYVDANGDGNQDPGEPDLADVDVVITESGGATQTVTTGSNGDWTATVPPGSTTADVDELDADFGLLVPPGFVQTEGGDPTTVTAVASASTNGGIDGYFVSGSITGTVLADTNNDNSGDIPMQGVTLTLKDGSGGDIDSDSFTSGVQPTTTTTDINGAYTFAGLAPGTYQVVETQPAGYLSVGDTDGGTDNVVAVILPAAGTGIADFVEEQAATIGNLVWIDENNNGIKDSGESGLDGVVIELLDGSGNPIDSDPLTGGIQPTTFTTAGGGLYSFANVAPGNYRLRIATPPALYPLSSTVTDTADNGENDDDNGSQDAAGGAITSPVFALAAGENEQTLDFGLVAGATLGNLVWNDLDNDGIKDGGESGIDGVNVTLLNSSDAPEDDPNQAGVQAYIITTSGGGLFSFTNLVPGNYRMRIATPPALYPASSAVTDTSDNGEDDDDNGSQAMATAPVTSPLIALAHGETDGTVDFGFSAITGIYSISGQVRDDYDEDGNFSDNDTPVPNVMIKLYADTNGNGVYDSGIDQEIGSTTTDAVGFYQFTGKPSGTYFVEEVDPNPSNSTADIDGANDNLIKVVIAGGGSGSSSAGNDFLDGVDPSGYIYSPVNGQIILGGTISVTGPGNITILMDGSTGQYSFITDAAGTYMLTYSPPLGYMIDPQRPVAGPSFDPTGGPNPTVLGSAESASQPGFMADYTAPGNPYYLTFDLAPGDPFVVNNNIPLVEIKPTTLVAWQYSNPLGGQNGATQNADGDRFDNLQEYAFCYEPNTGVSIGCPLKVIVNANGTIDATVRRAANVTDVIYTLEYIADISASGANGAGWTDVTTILPTVVNNGNGTETATYLDLGTLPGLVAGRGFVRVRVDLDSNHDTVPEVTSRTLASGWDTRALTVQCQTCSMPFFVCDIYSGAVDSIVGNTLNVAASAGAGSVSGAFVSDREYYVEVLSGDNAGHRFDVDEAASTATTVVISTVAGNHNTLASVPANLAADVIAVRQHMTIDDVYVKSTFTATNNQVTADRLLFFNATTGLFDEIYWLFFNGGVPKWVLTTDAGLTDRGGRVVDPAEAVYVHCRTSAVSLTLSGHVRQNSFACPLKVGSNLIGSGFPMDQSPAIRQMTAIGGFTGGRDPTKVDQIRFWAGDTSTGTEAYVSHFLVEYNTLHQWSPQSNASLLNENNLLLFKSLHGAFIKSINGKSDWLIPTPWTP